MKSWVELSWKILALRGVIGIGFGLVALVWPGATVIAFAVLWGVWALLDGIGSLWHAFSPGVPTSSRVLGGLMGLVTPSTSPSTTSWG